MLRRKPLFSKKIVQSMFDMQHRNLNPTPTERADTWRVPSATTTGLTYTVTVADVSAQLVTTCTCKAGQAKRRCKHALLVLDAFNRDNRHWIALLDLQAERQAA